jgi:hypothetical protein
MDDLSSDKGDPKGATLLDEIFATPAEPVAPPPATITKTKPGKFRKIRGFAKTYASALKHSVYMLAVGPLSGSVRRALENVSVLGMSVRTADGALQLRYRFPWYPRFQLIPL